MIGMELGEMRHRVAEARVGHLATVRPDGSPHLVPITFALEGDTLYWAVDSKPKRTASLQRLRNLRHEPRVSVLVDAYTDDWSGLWWVRMDGLAREVADSHESASALAALAAKYDQYRDEPPRGPLIAIDIGPWSGWRASG